MVYHRRLLHRRQQRLTLMVSELERLGHSFSCGGRTITLRYDMAALLRLERRGLSYGDIFAERITGRELALFLEAAGADDPTGILRECGAMRVWEEIRAAVLLALPERDPLSLDFPEETGGAMDYRRLRCLVCDVMRKPEEFFWGSTIRELVERWQDFAVVKGFAKKPERMQMFDTEGME